MLDKLTIEGPRIMFDLLARPNRFVEACCEKPVFATYIAFRDVVIYCETCDTTWMTINIIEN